MNEEKAQQKLETFVVSRFIVVTVVFSVLMAWLGATAVSFYEREEYSVNWREAQWIQPSTPAAVAYYRHQLVIPGTVSKAYLRIAAPDSFDLYVNGKLVASNAFYSSYPSSVFDIAAYLTPGVNVFAIRVTRKTYPGPPEIIANGVWHSSGRSGKIQSDRSWRAINLEEVQLGGELHWYDRDFKDFSWPNSVNAEPKSRTQVLIQPWSNEELMQRFPNGQWIWSQANGVNATFSRELTINGQRLKHGWLGVSASGVYSILVNNTVVVSSAPVTLEYLDVYNIAPYLRQGKNHISIDVSDENLGGRMMIVGKAQVDGQWLDFSSGQHWLASTNNTSFTNNEVLAPVKVLSNMQSVSAREQWINNSTTVSGFPTLRPKDLDGPREFTWDEWVRILTLGGALFVAVSLGAFLFVRAFHWEISGASPSEMLAVYCKPYYFAIILLVFVVMLSFDTRVSMTKSLAAIGFFSVLAIVSFCLITIALEMLFKSRRSGRN
ncbi:MAG: hypothetical protein KUG56_06020 [Kordiimonadaceae bacterium]|nr:hypothetical protein [Kordiimonadaceae bacterium]